MALNLKTKSTLFHLISKSKMTKFYWFLGFWISLVIVMESSVLHFYFYASTNKWLERKFSHVSYSVILQHSSGFFFLNDSSYKVNSLGVCYHDVELEVWSAHKNWENRNWTNQCTFIVSEWLKLRRNTVIDAMKYTVN